VRADIMKTIALVLAVACAAIAAGPTRAQAFDSLGPCDFDFVTVPRHPSSSERIGLRLQRGLFGPGAGPGVARATIQSNAIFFDVVQTRDRDAFPGYHAIGDVLQDVFAHVGPLAPGSYPVFVTVSSFVDGVTNVPCAGVLETLTVGTTSGSVTTLDAIEFHNAPRDRYFLTADPGEIARLDAGAEPGWMRTGRGFKVYASEASDGRAYPVDRFFSPKLDAHFFTASYREFIVLFGGPEWQLESQPFDLALPDTLTGECPDRTTPVFRLFNPRNGDHRYTTDAALAASQRGAGWIQEGYGDVAVAMCAPLT
jgi:hypothetical protein